MSDLFPTNTQNMTVPPEAKTPLQPAKFSFFRGGLEVAATYALSNINCAKLENLIHRFFEPAKLNIEIKDRFDNPIIPREWFLVPLFIMDEAVEKIKDGSIVNFKYDPIGGKLVEQGKPSS